MITVLLAGLHKILPNRLSDISKIWTLPTHKHLYYWIINLIIQIRPLMMSKARQWKLKTSHHNCNAKPPRFICVQISSVSGFCDHSICLHYHFLFSCRLDTDVFSFPFLNPSISHTSAPRNEDKQKKASTSTCLWCKDFSNSVELQSSQQFWKGHYLPLVHKLDGNLKDLLSSSIGISWSSGQGRWKQCDTDLISTPGWVKKLQETLLCSS